jgi:tetratricopeptide (TPR) repeat protein
MKLLSRLTELMRVSLGIIFSMVFMFPSSGWGDNASGFVGAETCGACHQVEYRNWQQSHHASAMREADEESVLGDFDDAEFMVQGVESRFLQKDGHFLVETPGDSGRETYPITHTFGVSPLQQYLVGTKGGRYQALNLAWDTRPQSEGGQRWFHLRQSIDPSSPFFWTRHFQNWNARCADCHSTNVKKQFDPMNSTYQTSFSEVNVACEACHGPGRKHVASHEAGGESVPMKRARSAMTWHFEGADPIANPRGDRSDAHIDMCGGCHSRRSVIAKGSGGYHDEYRLSLLSPGLYEFDGQIRDEVFVLGSFLQSRMHQAGVTCMNCHEPHSGAVKLPGNALCAQCHAPVRYETAAHKLHPSGPGSECVDCHMPARTYMTVDDRRDHSFSIPNPALTRDHEIPNACNDCHEDRSPAWALEAIGRELPAHRFAALNAVLETRDPLQVSEVTQYIEDRSHPAIRRASLLARLPVTDDALRLAMRLLNDESPLVRAAATRMLSTQSPAFAGALLQGIAEEASPLVRLELARGAAGAMSRLKEREAKQLSQLIGEYRRSLSLTEDFPSTRTALGMLEWSLGRYEPARAHLESAIEIEPHYLPAILNLADLHRAQGQDMQSVMLLEQAISAAPDSAAASHSYGLLLVRQGKTTDAIEWLERTAHLDDAIPRYAYVHAVALDSLGKTREAVSALSSASERWPNQADLLSLEVMYREKTGMLNGINQALLALSRVAGEDPRVKQWLERYPLD